MELESVSSMSSVTSSSSSGFRSTTSITTKKSAPIIHMRENSMEELEALFDPSKWPKYRSSVSGSLPLHKRNLPTSFFRPPPTSIRHHLLQKNVHHLNAHLRQSSVDQTNLNGVGGGFIKQQQLQPTQEQMNKEPLVVAASTQQQQTPMHLRSVSEPVSMIPLDPNNPSNNDPNSLPYGWQQARTVDGRIYYIKY